jgi:hypothetical protein
LVEPPTLIWLIVEWFKPVENNSGLWKEVGGNADLDTDQIRDKRDGSLAILEGMGAGRQTLLSFLIPLNPTRKGCSASRGVG